MSSNKSIQKTGELFGNNLGRFINNIDSLEASLHLTMSLISVSNKVNRSKLIDFVKDNAKKKTLKSLVLNSDNVDYFKKLKKELDISITSFKIVPRSNLISLISQFDAFMGSIIRAVLKLHPELLINSEKSLTYKVLSNIKTIDDAKEFIIEKEIESVLRENHTHHFEWLEQKLSIPLRKDLSIWSQFIELTERRNLFAHNGGIVSSQYIAICKEHGVELEKDLKIGDELDVSPQYFNDSYKCLYELGVKLTQVLWRKLLPKDLDNADSNLHRICYDLIDIKAYSCADNLLEFATKVPMKYPSATSSNIFVINRALSKKMGGNKKLAYEIINNTDWSACSNDFKLAKDVILDNTENVFKLMKKIGKKGELIEKSGYRDWPLFSELRKNKKFQEIFKSIYKEDLNLKENRLEYDIKLTVKPKKSKRVNKKKH